MKAHNTHLRNKLNILSSIRHGITIYLLESMRLWLLSMSSSCMMAGNAGIFNDSFKRIYICNCPFRYACVSENTQMHCRTFYDYFRNVLTYSWANLLHTFVHKILLFTSCFVHGLFKHLVKFKLSKNENLYSDNVIN